ncbi:MAG TPA: FAD-dependent oxidoreductase, partial [Nocardioidaceae bacterium]|nr:FAD-dependent oxidoreductase [Nocardioidaceae bacterium]
MTSPFDFAIVGAGAMGSAAAWALSKAGRSVAVLEQYALGHDKGGSHGATRIFRVGTEQAHYLEMAEQSRNLWTRLESETGTELLTLTGAVEHGMSSQTAQEFSRLLTARRVEHELLDAAAATERWPGMRFAGPVLHQSGGGILHADQVVSGLQRLAVAQGAVIHAGTRVDRISVTEGKAPVHLHTAGGVVQAERAIVTVGSWAHQLLDGVVALPPINVTQEQPRFFGQRDLSQPWPCFVHWRDDDGEWGKYESYGLYEAGAGVKVGLHASGPPVDPDDR